MKDDINSIMKEVEEVEKEFVSNVKTSQEKIKKILEKLSQSIINNAKKDEKDLVNEKKVMEAIFSFVEKVEELEEAIEVAKTVGINYLKGKNLPEEEVKKWIYELEKRNFKNSREVSQYLN